MMNRYRTVVRTLFAVIFIGGGISHLILGRSAGDGYAAFGETALLGWLSDLWSGFVMPNIGWLTLLLAVFEISVGVGLLLGGRWTRLAVAGMLGFFTLLLVLGYGFPASGWDDFLKNRLGNFLMAGLILPVLLKPKQPGIVTAWRQFFRRQVPQARSRVSEPDLAPAR